MKILSLLLLIALPVLAQQSQVANQTQQTVTPEVLANLQWFAEYSAAAYCSDNYLVPFNGSVICPSSVCPLIPTGPSVQIADSFIKVNFYQTTGLIMLDHTNHLLSVSFRGTHTNRDWLTDLNFLLQPADDLCKSCQAHSGFLGSWRGVRKIVLDERSALRSKYPGYQTVATGHSLGGALATLCAAQMKKVAPAESVYLFTYGSPRVGDDGFAAFVDKTFGWKHYRVTHLNDPIPRLPPQWAGFSHPGPEYSVISPQIPGVLSANSSTLLTAENLVVNTSDVLVLPGSESKLGNYGYGCTNPATHGSYLGAISGCLPHDLAQQDAQEDLCGDLMLCC